MPASSSWALQQAVYAKLTGATALVALLGGAHVYDHVPRNAPLPYVTFGQSASSDWSTATDDGEEHVLTLHVWSEGGGRRQSDDIMRAVRDALHEADLALDGHRLVLIRQEFSDVRRDPDGETMHGIIRYRALVEPSA